MLFFPDARGLVGLRAQVQGVGQLCGLSPPHVGVQRTQPAQSPDLNINDLGLFAALSSRVWTERFGSLEELNRRVERVH